MKRRVLAVIALAMATAGLVMLPAGASAGGQGVTTVATGFSGPLFGLNVGSHGALLVADSGAGPTRIGSNGSLHVIAPIPGVSDVIAPKRGALRAVQSNGPTASKLYRVTRGSAVPYANIGAFEANVDPADDGVESNPFDLADFGNGRTLVADAAGNSVLVVNRFGHIDWVASLPQHVVPTAPIKQVAGCPNGPPDICGLPATFSADPVATSVAVGPDGWIYVGELTGFPASPGYSRIWRIDPSARHARCGSSAKCTVVGRGFTSILDLQFARSGALYVVELDENSWLALEAGLGAGGSIDRCWRGSSGLSCTKVKGGLNMPSAVAIKDGRLYSTLDILTPAPRVVRIH
jgi:hypothetical protein